MFDPKQNLQAIENLMLTPNDKFILIRLIGGTVDFRTGQMTEFEAIRIMLAAFAGLINALQKSLESSMIDPATGKPFMKKNVNGGSAGKDQ